jgi:iron complex transport system substrate-binding protein
LSPGNHRLSVLFGLVLVACPPPASAPRGLVTVDDAGDSVRIVAPARRVVSLSPATTELLFAIGAGDRVAGRTRWCDYPAEAAAVPSVGDGLPPNIEAVLSRHPDLVLIYKSAQNVEAVRQLAAAGVPTLQLTFDHLADVPRVARLLGPLVDHAAASDSLATAFDSTLASVRGAPSDSTHLPKVLLLAWDQPPIAIGAGSFQSEILTLAGGRNLFADVPGPSAPVSIEIIAARNPDLILVSDSGVPGFASRSEWRTIPAVKAGRFVHLTTTAFGRPSPRAPDLIRALRAALNAAPR